MVHGPVTLSQVTNETIFVPSFDIHQLMNTHSAMGLGQSRRSEWFDHYKDMVTKIAYECPDKCSDSLLVRKKKLSLAVECVLTK